MVPTLAAHLESLRELVQIPPPGSVSGVGHRHSSMLEELTRQPQCVARAHHSVWFRDPWHLCLLGACWTSRTPGPSPGHLM